MSSRPASFAAHREAFALNRARVQNESASTAPPASAPRAGRAAAPTQGPSRAELTESPIAREIVSPSGIPPHIAERTKTITVQNPRGAEAIASLASATSGRVGVQRVESPLELRGAVEGVLLDALNRRGLFVMGVAAPPGTGKLTAVTAASSFVAGAKPLVINGGALRGVTDLWSVFGAPPGYVGSESRAQALLGKDTVAQRYGERAVGVVVVDELGHIDPEVRTYLAYALGARLAQGDLCEEARPAGEPTSWVVFALGHNAEVTTAFLSDIGDGIARAQRSLKLRPEDKPLRAASLVRLVG